MKLVTKTLVLVLVLALMLCVAPAVFADAGDSASDPVKAPTVPTDPIEVTADTTVWYMLHVGGKQLTVSATAQVQILSEDGKMLGTAGGRMPAATIAFPGEEGDVVIGFKAVVANAEVTLEVSDLVYGTENCPDPVENYWYENTGCYIMKPELEAGDGDGYYWSYTVSEEDDGKVMYLYSAGADVEYILTATYDGFDGYISDGNPISTYRLTAGTEIIINIYADYNDDWEIPALSTILNMYIVEGNAQDSVRIYSEGDPFYAYVNAGSSITYNDASTMSHVWAEKGVKISAKTLDAAAAIASTTVTAGGVTYTDTDNDGYIEFTLGTGGESNGLAITINNNGDADMKYEVEFVEPCTHADAVHHDLVKATCTEDGNYEYWVCSACGEYLVMENDAFVAVAAEDVVIQANGHDTKSEYHEYKAPTCTEAGNYEYYLCGVCGSYLQKDEENQQWVEVTREDVVLRPLGHSDRKEYVEAKRATCDEAGNYEYWWCTTCGAYLQKDEENQQWVEVTREDVVILPLGHERIEKVDAVPATETEAGNIEYWYCSACSRYFAERAALTELFFPQDIVVLPHKHNLHEVAVKYPTCTENGMKAHYACDFENCDAKFEDAEGKNFVTSDDLLLFATGHATKLEHYDAVAPTCTTAGCIEFWVCPTCHNYLIKNEEGASTPLDPTDDYIVITSEDVRLVPTGHSTKMQHFDSVKATCTEAGCIEFWVCDKCHEYLIKDEAGAATPLDPTDDYTVVKPEEVKIIPMGHSTKSEYIEYKAPTATEDGHIAYFKCPVCGVCFLKDAANGQYITLTSEDIIIPAGTNPETGDVAIEVIAVMAIVSMGAVLVLGKKKFF